MSIKINCFTVKFSFIFVSTSANENLMPIIRSWESLSTGDFVGIRNILLRDL